jgi:biopolymer transport protein ExbB
MGGADFSLLGMWKSMGIPARLVVIVLAIMSIYSLSVMAERLFSFARAKEQSRRYAEKLRDLLPGHQLVEAASVANTLKYGHIPRVLGSGIAEYNRGREALSHQGPHDVGEFDLVEAINRSIERATLRVTADLRRGLSGLATVASSSPFVGLLGTVLGIITAFQLMATSGSGGLASVSAGISEALVTTAFGLLVAIPALMMFNYLTNRVEEMTVDIADASNELVDFFLKEGRFDEPLTNPGANKQPAAAATSTATVRPPQPKA